MTPLEPLDFAHPEDHKRAAAKALVRHKTIRKAAQATGIPKSTIHSWMQSGDLDVYTDDPDALALDPEDQVDVPRAGTKDGTLTDPIAGEVEPIEPMGLPSKATAIDGTQPASTTPPPSAGGPLNVEEGSFDVLTQGGMEDWFPASPKALKALLRYVNALLSGADPDVATAAVQRIDPDFGLTPGQHTRLLDGLSTMMMSEGSPAGVQRLLFGSNGHPPPYVRSVYDQYAMNQSDITDLTSILNRSMTDAYVQGINTQLAAIGRTPITSITDRSVLDWLNGQAAQQATAIADTYNSTLAGQVGSNWVRLVGERGNQTSRWWLASSIKDWSDTMAEWKSTQVSQTTASVAYHRALSDYNANSGTVMRARIRPLDAQCIHCQDLVDQYGDWGPADEVLDAGVPVHPNCLHEIETQQLRPGKNVSIWSAQAPSVPGMAQPA